MKTSLYTLLFGDLPLEDAIQVAAEAGYEGIEIMGREPHLPPSTPHPQAMDLRELIDDVGLKVSCLAGYSGGYSKLETDAECQQQLDDLRRMMDLAELFGCSLIRHRPGGPAMPKATPEQLDRAVAWVAKAADEANQRGIRLALELHFNHLIESAVEAACLLGRIERSNVGLIHDAGNMFIGGHDFGEESVRLLSHSIYHVHVKDIKDMTQVGEGPISSRGHRFAVVPLGHGDVDHLPAFRALAQQGYTGYFSSEFQSSGAGRADAARHELAQIQRLIKQATS